MLSLDNLSTRERSLRAAVEVVRHEGLHALTTRAIARRSGLTQPAIYRHFRGKEELVRDVLGEIRALFYERLAGVGGSDPRERVLAGLDQFRDFAIDEPRLYDALFLQVGDGAAVPRPVDPSREGNIFSRLVELVRACAAAGVIQDRGPVATALGLAGHAQGLVLLYRQGRFGSKERFAEFYRRSIEDLLRGLA